MICTGNIYQLYNIDMKCPNFDICHKMMDPRLKVCGTCFWRFENQVLESNECMQCPVCSEKGKCFKFRKCDHFVCKICFPRLRECPMCFNA